MEVTDVVSKEAYYIRVGQPTNYFVVRDWVRVNIDPRSKIPDQTTTDLLLIPPAYDVEGIPPPSTK